MLDGEKGEQSGKDALRVTVGRVCLAEGTDTVHLTLNAVIDQVGSSPDRTVARRSC